MDLVLTDAAVVATLRLGVAGRREAVRATVLHQGEFLLDAEHRLVLLVLLRRADGRGPGVGGVRLAVDEVHLTHREHVVATADRVRVDGDRLEHAVALVAGGLVRARAVETPDRKLTVAGDDLRLGTEFRRRLGAVDPDVLSLVDHCCPQSFQGFTRGRTAAELTVRWRAESSQRAVAERLLCCERRVNSSTDCFGGLTTSGPSHRCLHVDDRHDWQPRTEQHSGGERRFGSLVS